MKRSTCEMQTASQIGTTCRRMTSARSNKGFGLGGDCLMVGLVASDYAAPALDDDGTAARRPSGRALLPYVYDRRVGVAMIAGISIPRAPPSGILARAGPGRRQPAPQQHVGPLVIGRSGKGC
jgi:hypothetical protein